MLSDEAKVAIEFCRRSPVVKINKITAGVSIWLGNPAPKDPSDDWFLYPRLLCSLDCFKELQQSGLLIEFKERWLSHRELAYTATKI